MVLRVLREVGRLIVGFESCRRINRRGIERFGVRGWGIRCVESRYLWGRGIVVCRICWGCRL